MKKAFTLIELLVVVLIIGILAAIAIPQYQKAVDKARFTQMIIAAKAIKEAQEAYYMANGTYATDKDKLDIEVPESLTVGLMSCSTGTPYASYIRWDKLTGVLLISAYDRQCEQLFGNWSGKKACYASNGIDRANSLCAAWTGKTKKTQAQPSGYYEYPF